MEAAPQDNKIFISSLKSSFLDFLVKKTSLVSSPFSCFCLSSFMSLWSNTVNTLLEKDFLLIVFLQSSAFTMQKHDDPFES